MDSCFPDHIFSCADRILCVQNVALYIAIFRFSLLRRLMIAAAVQNVKPRVSRPIRRHTVSHLPLAPSYLESSGAGRPSQMMTFKKDLFIYSLSILAIQCIRPV